MVDVPLHDDAGAAICSCRFLAMSRFQSRIIVQGIFDLITLASRAARPEDLFQASPAGSHLLVAKGAREDLALLLETEKCAVATTRPQYLDIGAVAFWERCWSAKVVIAPHGFRGSRARGSQVESPEGECGLQWRWLQPGRPPPTILSAHTGRTA